MKKCSSAVVGRAVSSFFEPLENRQLLSLVVDLRLPGGAKSANVSSVGQVINMEIWATAKGSNSTGSDEGLQIAVGSLLSTNVNGGAANGTLKVSLLSPFTALASSNGQQKDLDGDGDLDVGSNDNSTSTNFVYARSSSLTTNGSVSGSSQSWKLGTATFTVTSLKSTTGQTNLVWRVRDAKQAALWREDGSNIYKNGDTGSYSGGSALVLKRGGTTTTGTIAGNVWNDSNGNGSKDSGEAGKSGVKVYVDKNKNGVLDSGEWSATTDSGGNYKISGISSGSWRVRTVGVSGYRVSSPSSGYYDNISVSGNSISGKNFGLTQKVLITGRLWVDSDNDGVKDSTESVLSGWQVYIDKNKNGKLDSGEPVVTTDSSGNYSFKSLSAGSYRVRVVQKTGYTRLAPSSGYYDLSLTSGQSAKDKNFRYKKA